MNHAVRVTASYCGQKIWPDEIKKGEADRERSIRRNGIVVFWMGENGVRGEETYIWTKTSKSWILDYALKRLFLYSIGVALTSPPCSLWPPGRVHTTSYKHMCLFRCSEFQRRLDFYAKTAAARICKCQNGRCHAVIIDWKAMKRFGGHHLIQEGNCPLDLW